MNWRAGMTSTLLLEIMALCLLGQFLSSYYGFFQKFEASLPLFQWMLLVPITVWCVIIISLTFSLNDLSLIGLLLIAITIYFIGYTAVLPIENTTILLAGVTFGKGARFLLKAESEIILSGLVVLLAFSAWWHLDMACAYHGSRWMGLWDNPNTYGMLMGAGGVLAIGLLARMKKEECRMKKPAWVSWNSAPRIFLWIALFMLGVGLVMSYSRGAWLGTAVGLFYMTWSYGKLKWRLVLLVVAIVAAMVLYFWGSTADSAPWYVKRTDLGRPSAQHRATAWRAGLEMMRDHPLGVGWNNAVSVYEKNYSPPENGASALTTNDYLMLGTQLGIAALICFVCYVGLCLRGKCNIETEEGRIQAACRAGAIVLLVAFWFDGGLFKLPTAAVFWILLELGSCSVHRQTVTSVAAAAA
jgi:hypothetical protein